MSKTALVNAVAPQFKSKVAAEEAVDAVFGGIEQMLRGGQPVQIRGFGNFAVKDRQARIGRNPGTGEAIKIAAKKAVTFKPGFKI